MMASEEYSSAITSSIKCASCETNFRDMNELEIHITVDHLNWFPFQCFYCQFVRLPTEFALRTHLMELHPNRDPMLLYKIDDAKKEQLSHLLAQSVPSFPVRHEQDRIENDFEVIRPTTSSTWRTTKDEWDRCDATLLNFSTKELSPSPPIKIEPNDFDQSFVEANIWEHVSEQERPVEKTSDEKSTGSTDRTRSSSPDQNSLSPFLYEIRPAPHTPLKMRACMECGQYVTPTCSEQQKHVIHKHVDKKDFLHRLYSNKSDSCQSPYVHSYFSHKIRLQLSHLLFDMTYRCFPNSVALFTSLNREKDLQQQTPTKSRSPTPPSTTANESSLEASGTPSSRPKLTRCAVCLMAFIGSNRHWFDEHVAAHHFSEKLFRCEQCDFASSRKQSVKLHRESTGHDVEDRREELQEALRNIARHCFPMLSY